MVMGPGSVPFGLEYALIVWIITPKLAVIFQHFTSNIPRYFLDFASQSLEI